jgi:hypothetical protein
MKRTPLLFVSRLGQVLAALTLSLALAGLARAHPSGGPYGPQAQRYELPKVSGKIYYAAPGAPASATGLSLEQACSLSSAIARVVTGDAIVLRGGEYRTGDLKVNQGVVIQPYADEQPVLKGTEIATDWTRQRNGLFRTKWEHLFPGKPADWWRRESVGAKTPPHRFNMDMVFVDGRRLHSAGWEGELDADSFYIDYTSGCVYLSIDPKDHLVEITAHDGGLLRSIAEVNGKAPDHGALILRGIGFTQYAYRALEIDGREPEGLADPASYGNDVPDCVIENVSITHCSRVGAYLRGDRLKVINCLVSDTVTEGIYVLGSKDCLLERNIIRRNNVDNMLGYFPSAVKIFNQSHRMTCRDNLVVEMHNSNGIWWDVGNRDGVMVDNYVEDAQTGFFFEISKGALCVGNVFVNCEDGSRSLNSCNVEVYHNTYVNSPATFERTERSAVADHFGWHPSTGPDVKERTGHVFVGNLVVADERFPGALLRVRQAAKVNPLLRDLMMAKTDDNLYVRTGLAPKTLIEWGPGSGDAQSIPVASLAELRALQPGFEAGSDALYTGMSGFFVSPEMRDFSPRNGLVPASVCTAKVESLPARVQALLCEHLKGKLVPGTYLPATE